jgi:hypothetical protein
VCPNACSYHLVITTGMPGVGTAQLDYDTPTWVVGTIPSAVSTIRPTVTVNNKDAYVLVRNSATVS